MDGIKKLKEIRLINKVLNELNLCTKLNISQEKLEILAKYIIHLVDNSSNFATFQTNLLNQGGDFPFHIIENIYNIIKETRNENIENKNKNKEEVVINLNEDVIDLNEDEENNKKEKIFNNLGTNEKEKNEQAKTFKSLTIKNKNKEELDIELGVIFDENEIKKNKIKINKNIQPIILNNKKNNRSRSRSKSKKKDKKEEKKRHHHHHHSDSSSSNEKEKKIPTELIENRIYDGVVTRMEDYGCFVLLNIKNNKNNKFHFNNKPYLGFVHISQMRTFDKNIKYKQSVRELVKINKKVKVKVLSIDYKKYNITLSMNQVDQITGEDLSLKIDKNKEDFNSKINKINENIINNNFYNVTDKKNYGELTGIYLDTETGNDKELDSQELWELTQLKSANAFELINEPVLKINAMNNMNELTLEENVDVELKDEEPAFLKGQTSKTGIIFNPIKIIKNPDGVMHRAAIEQAEKAKTRKELKEYQLNNNIELDNNIDNINSDIFLSKSFNDNFDLKAKNILSGNYQLFNSLDGTNFQPKKFFVTPRSTLSIKEQRESLPIYQFKNDLRNAIRDNRIIIVIGETGSGKTTQITQYLVEWGYAKYGKVGCTQPRRVAAQSVAKRVSQEYGCKLGEYVGYNVRFDDCTSEDTIIKYMTDGMLLREALIDKNLTQYSVIMLDEAHERTIHTDILFGLLKETLRHRNDLKLIVTSATLESEKFSKFFNDCPVFKIPGRTFDVEIFYSKEPEYDYMESALITCMQIHLTEKQGDILVFLTGQEEIDSACQILQSRMDALGNQVPKLIILPVYSALPAEQQIKIFEPAPHGCRKCIIATNIAEASLTIDGIYYVVDSGFCKMKAFNPKIGMDSLVVVPISQSSALQRAGRAGRTGPGKCFRLYTYDCFNNEMLKASIPEIQRTNLANTVLLLKALGINDLIHFEFMDPPPIQSLINAMEQLYYLGALDDEGLLTKLGRRMAEFPLEPQLSKTLLASVDLGCSEEIINIVSMLTVTNIFYRPKDKQNEADSKRAKFLCSEGDHLTLLNVFEMFKRNHSSQWCQDNFIHYRALKRAEDVKKQIITIMERYNLPIKSCQKNLNKVRKSITAGFFYHTARKDPKEGYKSLVDNQTIYIHPSSAVYNKSPQWVVYHELILTSKEYMVEITTINPRWLIDVAGKFFKKCNPNVISKRQKNEKIEPLQGKYEDVNAWRLSKRRGNVY